jgi:hypothetical protein
VITWLPVAEKLVVSDPSPAESTGTVARRFEPSKKVTPSPLDGSAGQLTSAVRVTARRAERGQRVRVGVGGPLPDRGEQLRVGDHRRDPDGEQRGEGVPPASLLPLVRDLGLEIKEVLAAGSRNRGRWHRRAGVPRGRR